MYDVLNGVRVVELSTWLFMPSAAVVLADWGADVVKVENATTGDPSRGLVHRGMTAPSGPQPFVEVGNRGKRSVAIDVGTADGLALLYELVAQADVFMTNVLPDARARLKIDVEDLRAVNPELIYARGSGYGTRGPDARRPGFDLAAAWASGGSAYAMTLPDDDHPAFQAGSFGDLTAGVTAAGAVAAALYRRERTGSPAVVDVALLSVGMWLMSQLITAVPLGMGYPTHRREEPWNPAVNSYRTKDGRWLFLVLMQADRDWEDLCLHLDRPDLVDAPHFRDAQTRAEHSREVTQVLDEVFAQRTLDEWTSRLATLRGVWAPALSPAEVVGLEQVSANGFLAEVDHPASAFSVVASPAQFDDAPLGKAQTAPEHGQHTEEVLLELGHDWDDILLLKERGAIL